MSCTNQVLSNVFFLIVLFFFVLMHSNAYAQQTDIDELIELDISDLMEIKVISASKTIQTINEVPATVRVVTAKQIKERGYFSLEDVLSDLPGFQFRNIIGFNSYSFLRGAPSQNNLIQVLVDGIQINELNSGGFYGGIHYNLANVKQIEVVYGPSSALYGTNAISGIVNIITNEPEDLQGGSVNVLGGSFNTASGDGRYGYYDETNELGFVVSATYKQSDKADLAGSKGDNNWTTNMENFENDLVFDGKVKFKDFKAGFVFQDKIASRTTNYKTIGTDYLDSGTEWHIRFFNGYASYVYDNNTNWFSRSQIYYRNATVMNNTIAYIRADTAGQQGQVGYYRPNNLIGFEEQFNYQFEDNLSLVAGLKLEKEQLAEGFSKSFSGDPNIEPPTPEEPKSLNNDLLSIYLQGQYKFIPSTELTIGLRHDNSSYYGKVYTPRVGIVYGQDKFTAKILYMEAFRAPKPWDYTWGDGNPDLVPERMASYEFIVAYNFTDNLTSDISLYKNSIRDKLTKSANPKSWVNSDQLDTEGLELSLEYIKGRIGGYLNYTWNNSEFKDGEEVPEIAHHGFNTGISYSFTKNLKVVVRGNYLGERKNPVVISTTGDDKIEAYFVLHSTISFYEYNNFDAQLSVNNLLDTEYFHTSNRPPQRTILFKTGFKL